MFENLIEKLKKNPTTLVFTEGPDPRILEAASRLKKEGILEPLLVGNPEEVQAAAAKGGFDITDIRIVDPANYRRMDELVEKMVELRKGKMSPEECKAALLKERSPSCGCGQIYDGTFSKTLVEGDGMAAQMLKKHGLTVYGESQIGELVNTRPFFYSI